MDVVVLVGFWVFSQPVSPLDLDPALLREIGRWQKGAPPPGRLLHFPDGPPAVQPLCAQAIRRPGPRVGDYLARVADDDLLTALLFDPRSDAACVRAAARRLVELRGLLALRAALAERRVSDPAAFRREEIATLGQLAEAPYARVQVVSVDRKEIRPGPAESALAALKADLTAGVPWARAYRAAADALPDTVRSRAEGGGSRTFLCYQYDGLISPTGFDLLDRRVDPELDPSHVRKVFAAKSGVHRMDTVERYWLYYVEAVYE